MRKTKNMCVTKEWTHKLSWKQQTVLLSALRGCDGLSKEDCSKRLTRRLRYCILHCADDATGYMHGKGDESDVQKMVYDIDKYPMHFLFHFAHACEIIGYCCDKEEERDFFNYIYLSICEAVHLKPESLEELNSRLSDK